MAANRREFLEQALRSILATSAPISAVFRDTAFAQAGVDALADAALKANQKELVIAGAPGAFGALTKRIFYDPFTAATGIMVVPVPTSQGERLAKLQAQYTSGASKEWDVVVLPADRLPGARAFLRDLGDCSGLPNVVSGAPKDSCLGHAVMTNAGAGVLAFDLAVFPDGKPQPANWADFWDIKRFPGQRTMPNIGSPWWVLAAALVADGADPKKLFPLDVDRGLKKLDTLKPNIVWWTSGDQSMQLMRSREVVMGMMFLGRAVTLRNQGVKTKIIMADAPLDANFWAVTKDAPHPLAGLALINFFFSRPEAHVELLKETGEATLFKPMLALLDAETRKIAAVDPDNWGKLIIPDTDYLAKAQDRLLARWNAWLAS
jgi:mannopine transport system substrate-binding protein